MGIRPYRMESSAYDELKKNSLEPNSRFWLECADSLTWTKKPTTALCDAQKPYYKWFPGGETNMTVTLPLTLN